MGHVLDLPRHRVQAYHVLGVLLSTVWFHYEDTVRHGDRHA